MAGFTMMRATCTRWSTAASILLHLNEEGQLRAIIVGLREQHRRLRALREELDRAGL
jgi:hypothetical protein